MMAKYKVISPTIMGSAPGDQLRRPAATETLDKSTTTRRAAASPASRECDGMLKSVVVSVEEGLGRGVLKRFQSLFRACDLADLSLAPSLGRTC